MTFRIIGISGRAGAGKDTVAKHLSAAHGFTTGAFADPLKEAAAAIFRFTEAQLYGDKKEVVDPFWGKTPRRVLQLLGTDCVRNVIDNDVWVKAMERTIEEFRALGNCPGIAIPDVRFPNEFEAVQRWGGEVWRVERPSALNVEPHVSETALDKHVFDLVLSNTTDVSGLGKLVDFAMMPAHTRSA